MKIWVALLAAVAASAQAPAPQAKAVIGEVSAIDASAKQLTLKTDSGVAYTVKLDDSTKYLRIPPGEKDLKNATPTQLSELNVGDRVLARGAVSEEDKTVPARTIIVMTKSDLAKKHEEEQQAWQRGVVGTVAAVNPASKEVTITLRGITKKTVVVDASAASGFLRYAPGSYQFSEAKPSTFDEIRVGDTVRARGQKNEDGSRIKADQILSGSFLTLAATVTSVDVAGGVVTATDLQTKKPVEIHTTNETLVRKIPEMMATMMARRMQAAAGGPGQAPPGGPAGGGAGQGGPGAGARGGEGGPGGPGGPGQGRPGGGPGGMGRGNFDLQSALERMPPLPLTDLKKGDAIIISSTKGAANLTAIILVAGVEPFLAAAPRSSSGQVNLGSWSFEGGAPEQ
jgi:hypothetical protein